jgi:hypothetical protein
MENSAPRVSVGSLLTGPQKEQAAGFQIIKAELESAGIVVDDRGPASSQESIESMLQFVLQIASDPTAQHVAETYVGAKLVDATVGDALKAVVAKLKSSGQAHMANIFKSLKEQIPNRKPQIIVAPPNGVRYPLPEECPDEAFAQIAVDVERQREIPDSIHYWDHGQWMTADEWREARKNKAK